MMRQKLLTFVPAMAALCCFVGFASQAIAQVGGGPPGGFGGGFGGGGTLGLLMNEQVRDELQLVDDQLAELREIGEEMRNEMRSMFEGIRELPVEDRQQRFANMREKMEEMREKMESKVSSVLLPHQVERLKQIEVQMELRRRGAAGALDSGVLAERLDLTEEQQEKVAEKIRQVQEEMQKKIADMRAKAQEEIISVLTPEQREKFKSLVGEPFEMQGAGFGGFRGGRPQGEADEGQGRRRFGQRGQGSGD